MRTSWRRYVAIGDSFTEGMSDPDPDRPGGYRGWADRLAQTLATDAHAAGGEFGYANLAVRGRLLDDIVTRQLTAALDLAPDLVSIVGGGNDILRPRADVDALAARLERAVAALRASGADVLMATPTDPRGAPVVQWTRSRAAVYIAHIHAIAQRHGAAVINQWALRALQDWRMWAEDRIHMTPEGHRRVALAGYAALHRLPEDEAWAAPLPPQAPVSRREQARTDLQWARGHLLPWATRRLRGRSSGDELQAKRPRLAPVVPTPDHVDNSA
jgi:lysophospholipase L1-like esterase